MEHAFSARFWRGYQRGERLWVANNQDQGKGRSPTLLRLAYDVAVNLYGAHDTSPHRVTAAKAAAASAELGPSMECGEGFSRLSTIQNHPLSRRIVFLCRLIQR
jgi:hypothetical protein